MAQGLDDQTRRRRPRYWVLAEALKGRGYRNAKVHSKKVLRFMSHLFHRKSKIPPPWVT